MLKKILINPTTNCTLELEMINNHGLHIYAMWRNNARVNNKFAVAKHLGDVAYQFSEMVTGGFVTDSIPKTHAVMAALDFVFFDPSLVQKVVDEDQLRVAPIIEMLRAEK